MHQAGNPRASPRRAARTRYLEVAAEVASQARPGVGRPFLAAHVELAELGAHLGRSRASLYRLWPSQHDFWTDLTLYLVVQNELGVADEELPWSEGDGHHPPRPDPATAGAPRDRLADIEVLRAGLGVIEHDVLSDQWTPIRAAMLAYSDIPSVADARRVVEQRRLRHLADRLAALLAGADRAVAPPLRPVDAAAALWSLGDGVSVLHRSQPAVGARVLLPDDGAGPRPWGLLAYALRALVVELTRPGRSVGRDESPAIPSRREAVPDRWTAAHREVLEAAAALFASRAGLGADRSAGEADEIRSLGHVTMAAVARAAGVSRRAVYYHWSSSEELRLDLLRWLMAAERRRHVAGLDRAIAAGRRPGLDRADAVVSAMLVRPPADRLPLPQLPLAFLVETHHPAVRATLARGTDETIAAVASRVEHLWPRDQRASGEVLDERDFAVLLTALVTGANRLLRANPAALGRPMPARRGPAALVSAVQALVDHRTNEVSPAGPPG